MRVKCHSPDNGRITLTRALTQTAQSVAVPDRLEGYPMGGTRLLLTGKRL